MGRLIDADEYEKRIKPYDTEDVMDKALYNFAHDHLVTTPTAQPECKRECTPMYANVSDCISRQVAIDALGERPMVWMDSDYEIAQRNQYDMDKLAIETVPPAQPEIVRCKDCMHNGSFDTDCPIDWPGKEFCNFGEREEDESEML